MAKEVDIHHKNDQSWWDSPQPKKWHRCWVQTWGTYHEHFIERCPCGAIRINEHGWQQKNSRNRP